MADQEEDFDALNINNQSTMLVSVDEDSTMVWDIKAGVRHFTLNPNQKETAPKYGIDLTHLIPERRSNRFNDANFSPDGKWLVTGDNSNMITIWNTETSLKTSTFYGYLSFPPDDGLGFDPNSYWESFSNGLVALKNDVQLSPDGKFAYRAKIGFEVRKWELATGKIVQNYVGHSKVVLDFAVSKKGDLLLTGGGDREVHLYDTKSGELKQKFVGHGSMIWDVGFSNDESKIVTSDASGNVMVWNITTGERIQSIFLSGDRKIIENAYTVKFSPNDLYLVVGNTGGALKRWDIDTGKQVQEFVGHTNVSMDF
jgi:WD40 repeat protein